MLHLDSLATEELIDLQQRVSEAVDLSCNEDHYTILDELEYIISTRESMVSDTSEPLDAVNNFLEGWED